MYRNSSFIFFLLLLVLFNSCRRVTVEKNSNPQGYADSQVVGTWKITGATSDREYDWDGNGTKETDFYSAWTDCAKDNLYQFYQSKTGTYQFDCNLTKEGTWVLADAFRIVMIPDGGLPIEERIITMTSNSFTSTSTSEPVSGQRFTISKVWTRQ